MRLIDSDELKKLFTLNGKTTQGIIYAVIDSCKTVDAIPVVRCGECEYYVECEGGLCTHPQLQSDEAPPTQKDRSCSYGERKDGEPHA